MKQVLTQNVGLQQIFAICSRIFEFKYLRDIAIFINLVECSTKTLTYRSKTKNYVHVFKLNKQNEVPIPEVNKTSKKCVGNPSNFQSKSIVASL